MPESCSFCATLIEWKGKIRGSGQWYQYYKELGEIFFQEKIPNIGGRGPRGRWYKTIRFPSFFVPFPDFIKICVAIGPGVKWNLSLRLFSFKIELHINRTFGNRNGNGSDHSPFLGTGTKNSLLKFG